MTGGETALTVVGVVLLGIVVLVVSMMVLAGRARPLERALRRLRLRTEEAEKIQTKAAEVQLRMVEIQDKVAVLQEKLPNKP